MTNQTPSASGPKPPRVEVLEEAAGLIDGDRNVSYGTPTQNFTNIAEMWTTRLRHKLLPGESFTASEVADLMILLKVARNISQQKRDNYVDLAGYAGCGYEATLPEEKQDDSPRMYVGDPVPGPTINITHSSPGLRPSTTEALERMRLKQEQERDSRR